MRVLVLLAGNMLAVYLAAHYVNGVSLDNGIKNVIIVGLVLSAVNFFLKPVLKLILGPFILLTFGLFLIVINMGTLWVTDLLLPQLVIAGLAPLLLATLVIGLVNFGVHALVKK